MEEQADAVELQGKYRRPKGILPSSVCPDCGSELTQKNRRHLVLAGAFIIVIGFSAGKYPPPIWPLPVLMVGAYLIAWGTKGKGLWCRQCKRIPADIDER